ncbi:uncharacterized protein LOC143257888 [Tachypleus tridentatus]|uniref:uncharacterized protein LOC143257888 n=1 Tax=Tachypleus tridentatus TaxID=6853 RepID=UPI003FCF9597
MDTYFWYSNNLSSPTLKFLRAFYRNKNYNDTDSVQCMILYISCKKRVRYDVHWNGRYVDPINAYYKKNVLILKGKNPRLPDDQYISRLYYQETGTNYYDTEKGSLHVVLQEGQEIDVRPREVLEFGLIFPVRLNGKKRTGPAEADLVASISSLLVIPTDGIRIVEIECCRDRRYLLSRLNKVEVQFQVSGDSVSVTNETLKTTSADDLGIYINMLVSAVRSGLMDKQVKSEVHSLWIRNHSYLASDIIVEGAALQRTRRQTNQSISNTPSFQTPYKILVCVEECGKTVTEVSVYEPLRIILYVKDANDNVVTTFDESTFWRAKVTETLETSETGPSFEGPRDVDLSNGMANFTGLRFVKAKERMVITFTVVDDGANSTSSSKPPPATFGPIIVKHRPLYLVQVSNGVPYNVKENGSLEAYIGVRIYDELTKKPAHWTALGNGTWKANVDFLYNDIYNANLLGEKQIIQQNGKNEFLFNDLRIDKWGYRYYLKVTVTDDSKIRDPLKLTIGPFDIGKAIDESTVIITSKATRLVTMSFNQDFSLVSTDPVRFHVYFLNTFGRKFSDVEWTNCSSSAGSVITKAYIQGTEENLDKATSGLSKEQEIVYDGKQFPLSKVSVDNKGQETGTNGQTELTNPKPSTARKGLPPAWIVAIVINCVLVALFFLFLFYCYCTKRKKNSRNSDTVETGFTGRPRQMYIGTVESPPIGPVYGARDERLSFVGDVNHYSDSFGNRPPSCMEPHCTCSTPECYCDDPQFDPNVQNYYSCYSEFDPNLQNNHLYVPPDLDPNVQNSHPTAIQKQVEETEKPEQQKQQEVEDENLDFLLQEVTEETEDVRADTRNSHKVSSPSNNTLSELPGAVGGEDDNMEDEISDSKTEEDKEQNRKKYLVYLMLDEEGSRECIGHLWLPSNNPVTLTQVRNYLAQAAPSVKEVTRHKYNFINESFREITFQEGALLVDRIYPSQGINIQLIKKDEPIKEKKSNGKKKEKVQRYYGPLGKCTEPECEKPARIKCTDCGQSAYCSTRCLRIDGPSHKKVCYRSPWKI